MKGLGRFFAWPATGTAKPALWLELLFEAVDRGARFAHVFQQPVPVRPGPNLIDVLYRFLQAPIARLDSGPRHQRSKFLDQRRFKVPGRPCIEPERLTGRDLFALKDDAGAKPLSCRILPDRIDPDPTAFIGVVGYVIAEIAEARRALRRKMPGLGALPVLDHRRRHIEIDGGTARAFGRAG